MTREEFVRDANDWNWWDLISWCYNNGYEYFAGDFYSNDARDEYIDDEIAEFCSDWNWRQVRDYLNDIPEPYYDSGYWYRDGYGNWIECDDERFGDTLNDLLDELDNDEFFDDDEEYDESGDVCWDEYIEENEPDAQVEICEIEMFAMGG